DEDRQQVGRAARPAGKDACQRLELVGIRLFVHVEAGGPVAAAHQPRDLDEQADIEPRQGGVSVVPVVDPHTGPGLAHAFRRRMPAQRDDARTEYLAAAAQRQFTLDLPRIDRRHATPSYAMICNIARASIKVPPSISTDPPAADTARGHGATFSSIISIASGAIHRMFITPTPSMTAINAQQQPIHSTPWCRPIANTPANRSLQLARKYGIGA